MRCNTCGDYIAKAKKFNARKETVENETYLGLKIFRFYFKCPCCMAEITFKTDPKNCDYELEHGATRNFQALRLAEQQAEREAKEKEEEEKLNPMKMLENRTKASRREMEELEALEELKDMSERNVFIDSEDIIKRKSKELEEEMKKQEEEDEAFVQNIIKLKQRNQSLVSSIELLEEIEEVEEVEEVDLHSVKQSSEMSNLCNFEKLKPQSLSPTPSSTLAPLSTSSSTATSSLLSSDNKNESRKRKLSQLIKVKAKQIK